MSLRNLLIICIVAFLPGCSGETKPLINDKPLTDAEKAAIKAADDAVNAVDEVVALAVEETVGHGVERGGVRGACSVIGGSGPHLPKKFAALFDGADEGAVIACLDAADLAQFVNICPPVGGIEVNDAIGAKGGDDAPAPT